VEQISITKGVLVQVGNKQLEVIASVSSNKVKAVDIKTGEVVLVSPGEIEFELKRAPTFPCSESDPAGSTSSIEVIKLIDASAEDIIQEAIDECYGGPGATSRRVIGKVIGHF
jgi:putative transposase